MAKKEIKVKSLQTTLFLMLDETRQFMLKVLAHTYNFLQIFVVGKLPF